jgi:hypothetical protein
MTETENKIEQMLGVKHNILYVRPDSEQNALWSVVRAEIAKWHDEEMRLLKLRCHDAALVATDACDFCTNEDRNRISHAILDVDKPAEPLRPFGCKCWRYDGLSGQWYPLKPQQMFLTLQQSDKFCRYCGKPRVSHQ